MHLETRLGIYEVVLNLLPKITITHAHEVLILNVLELTILVDLRWDIIVCCACVPLFDSMQGSLGNISALAMWVEIIVAICAVSIAMSRVLELTDDILLICSSVTWTHLILILIHHLLHQMVLAVLTISHIFSIEVLTASGWMMNLVHFPLHYIILMDIHRCHGLITLI